MRIEIPPCSVVQSALQAESRAEIVQIARLSGVPFPTLWHIRDGTTKNPGIETVRKFALFLKTSGHRDATVATTGAEA